MEKSKLTRRRFVGSVVVAVPVSAITMRETAVSVSARSVSDALDPQSMRDPAVDYQLRHRTAREEQLRGATKRRGDKHHLCRDRHIDRMAVHRWRVVCQSSTHDRNGCREREIRSETRFAPEVIHPTHCIAVSMFGSHEAWTDSNTYAYTTLTTRG